VFVKHDLVLTLLLGSIGILFVFLHTIIDSRLIWVAYIVLTALIVIQFIIVLVQELSTSTEPPPFHIRQIDKSIIAPPSQKSQFASLKINPKNIVSKPKMKSADAPLKRIPILLSFSIPSFYGLKFSQRR
jgi:hypothetical protein